MVRYGRVNTKSGGRGEGDLEVNGAIGKASPSPLLFVDVHVEDDLTSLAIYCRPKLGYAHQRWL